jgi:hypothetical protein
MSREPSEPDFKSSDVPLPLLTTVTLASGTAAPEGSRTVTTAEPVKRWARRLLNGTNTSRIPSKAKNVVYRTFRIMPFSLVKDADWEAAAPLEQI